jgi:Adenylate and Guanylate cyclase catalytic domain
MKHISTNEIRFINNSKKCCICFIDLVNSTGSVIRMINLEQMRKYYSMFINAVSDTVKRNSGIIIKNMGDSLFFYFPDTSDDDKSSVFAFNQALDCGFEILDIRHEINKELYKDSIRPFDYRISMDYGIVDLARVGDYNQIDLFGPIVNICAKINSSLSVYNEITIGLNFYRFLTSQSAATFSTNYIFSYHREYKITEDNLYPIYIIKRNNTTLYDKNISSNDSKHLCMEK